MLFRRISRALFLFAWLLLSSAPAQSQSSGDGSIYSGFGIGELTSYGTAQIQGMGGGGVALRSFNYVNLSNPASLGDITLTRAAAGLRFESVSFTDAQDESSRLARGSLESVQLAFPIARQRMGLGVSLAPYSQMNYRVRVEGMLVEPDSALYVVDTEGRGGLHEIQGALGYLLTPGVSVGASVGYIFGIMEDGRRTYFPSGGHAQTQVMDATRLGGIAARIATQIAVPGPLSTNDEVYLGARFSLPVSLTGDRVRTLGQSLDRDTLGTALDADVRLPWSIDAGVAYRVDRSWLIVLDGTYSPWTQFESNLPLAGYNPNGESRLADRWRVSGGVEVLPRPNDLLAPLFTRMAYRLGFYVDRSYVDPVDDFQLMTYAATGGFSVPALFSGTRLDINVHVGTRGTTDHNLVRDMFYRVSASINIGERWFEQRQLR